MNIPDYSLCDLPMRDDRTETHLAAWRHICLPGAHFTAAARIDMVREARGARTCRLCDARQATLSPYAVPGKHDTATGLSPPITADRRPNIGPQPVFLLNDLARYAAP